MSYNTYDKYISSETKWFDKIPKHWDIRPIKHLAKTIPGGTPSTSNLDYWENGSIPWLPSGMVQNCQIDEKDVYKYITEKGLLNSATKYIGPNSVLIALTGATCANIGYLSFKATANQSVISIEPYETFSKYIYYALLSQREQILDKKTGGAQSGINEEDVKHILIPTMNFEEQKQIANYLDKKTAKIDTTIAKNKELIQLLEEKRVALINQVVTKGLNPDVPMKDSGVEWIGEIPEHWAVVPLTKFLKSIVDYRGKTPEKVDNGIFLITGKNIKKGKLQYHLSQEYVKEEEYNEIMSRGKPEIGDLLFTTEAPLGEVANIDNTNVALAQRIIKMSGRDNIVNNYFLKYYIMSTTFQSYLQRLATGSTAQGIKASKLFLLKLLLLPYEEQQEIVDYLNEETEKIDTIISRIEKNINLLEEYKTSLIHHVVTGKIDVRGEEI